ncbi:unnamed protein product [Effrenium voratum]|nr:unnamed protein product [Effrenium voratum]
MCELPGSVAWTVTRQLARPPGFGHAQNVGIRAQNRLPRRAVTIDQMRKEIRRRRQTMDKLKEWRYALCVSLVVGSAVGVAFKKWRGRAGKTGFLVASAAGVAGFFAATRRWELKNISSEEVLRAFFPGSAAELFARLPATMEALQGRLGAEELHIPKKVEGFDMLRRLIDLSKGRGPYSEARKMVADGEVPEAQKEEVQLGLRVLPFAEVTYEADDVVKQTCRERGHQVLILESVGKPGEPAHFISFNPKTKEAILSIRGTKTPADALTDLAGDIEERQLEDGKKLFAHAGFLTSADSVLERVLPTIRELLVPAGYSLTVTGHSLGASTASLVTRLLYAEMASWEQPLTALRCVSYAPCPCMDSTNAERCAEGEPPLVLSFVCNDDAVPRFSMQNIGRLSLLGKGASVEEILDLAVKAKFRDCDQHVPGKVVVFHALEEKEKGKDMDYKPAGEWKAWKGTAADFPEVGYMELAPKSIAQHFAPYYREALAVVALALGLEVEAKPRAEEEYNAWLARTEPAAA